VQIIVELFKLKASKLYSLPMYLMWTGGPSLILSRLSFMWQIMALCREYVGLPQKLSKPAQNVDKQPLVVEKRYDI
jgi:hypothetical protein